jgi:hypothetical protein
MVGLVPTIQLSARSVLAGLLDPRDKRENDNGREQGSPVQALSKTR